MFVLALFFMSGCKQGENERCQMDSDCEEGYICCDSVVDTCLPKDKCNVADASTDAATDGGTDAIKTDAVTVDSAPKVDAPIVDAPKVDAPIVDAPKVDALMVDAPLVDAPIIDKSVKPDSAFTPDTKPAVDSTPLDTKAPAK